MSQLLWIQTRDELLKQVVVLFLTAACHVINQLVDRAQSSMSLVSVVLFLEFVFGLVNHFVSPDISHLIEELPRLYHYSSLVIFQRIFEAEDLYQ